MISNLDDLQKVKNDFEKLYLSKSFQLIVVGANILNRKALASEMVSPPYNAAVQLKSITDFVVEMKKGYENPVVLWDLDVAIHEHASTVYSLLKEPKGYLILVASQVQKASISEVLKKISLGVLTKPYSLESIEKLIKPHIMNLKNK